MHHPILGEVPKVPGFKVAKYHVDVIVKRESHMKSIRISTLNIQNIIQEGFRM
jgi:hypothetical protein